MGLNFDDLNKNLVDETLSEIADNFFGARIRVEQQLELLENFAAKLRERNEVLKEETAGFQGLLLGPENTRSLFAALDVDDTFPLPDSPVPENFSLPYLSLALTTKGAYVSYVIHFYRMLQKSIRYYMKGKTHLYVGDEDPVYYQMVEKMCDIVNAEIEKVNREARPGSFLSYKKRFDPLALSNEKIAGWGTSGYERLDREMAFKPVDFASLDLTAYPSLPKPEMAEPVIKKFCKSLYKREKDAVKSMLASLRKG